MILQFAVTLALGVVTALVLHAANTEVLTSSRTFRSSGFSYTRFLSNLVLLFLNLWGRLGSLSFVPQLDLRFGRGRAH